LDEQTLADHGLVARSNSRAAGRVVRRHRSRARRFRVGDRVLGFRLAGFPHSAHNEFLFRPFGTEGMPRQWPATAGANPNCDACAPGLLFLPRSLEAGGIRRSFRSINRTLSVYSMTIGGPIIGQPADKAEYDIETILYPASGGNPFALQVHFARTAARGGPR